MLCDQIPQVGPSFMLLLFHQNIGSMSNGPFELMSVDWAMARLNCELETPRCVEDTKLCKQLALLEMDNYQLQPLHTNRRGLSSTIIVDQKPSRTKQ